MRSTNAFNMGIDTGTGRDMVDKCFLRSFPHTLQKMYGGGGVKGFNGVCHTAPRVRHLSLLRQGPGPQGQGSSGSHQGKALFGLTSWKPTDALYSFYYPHPMTDT